MTASTYTLILCGLLFLGCGGGGTGLETCPDGTESVHCTPITCADELKNGTETDVDCGGSSCRKCAAGKSCTGDTDCTTRFCAANKCAVPSCTDRFKNGTETDVDCGGNGCAPCADNKSCAAATDCLSGICTANVCKPYPGSCMTNASFCADYESGVTASDVMGSCTCSGCVYSSAKCKTTGRVASCAHTLAGAAIVDRYYSPTTASQAMSFCSGYVPAGTYTAN